MKPTKTLIIVSLLAGLMAVVQSAGGLFWPMEGSPFPFTTLHGEEIQIYGQGLYQYDSYFKAPIHRGTDAVTLFVCVPLLVTALLYAQRGTIRGKLFLTSILGFLFYNSASVILGVAHNLFFLVYLAYFSTSLFAFVMAVSSMDLGELAAHVSDAAPRKGIAALMFVSALGLIFAWLPDIIAAAYQGTVPPIESYTTEVTYVIDLGIIVPAIFLTSVLILRRAPLSYLLTSVLFTIEMIIGIMVTVQTVFQTQAGIILPIQVLVVKAGVFVLLSLVALWLTVRLYRSITEPASRQQPSLRAVKASAR